ncbi:hypothetical protein [Bacillus sp. OV166]|uniref:hypothetical protein n=1 Tax=Bacillus sp. OV166 TaxID=1882763 RepID=UPI00211AF305|nr:hypothetical protein [Bacillus sp. OV166]
MDGWTTCEKIREFSDVPIIMLTARNAVEQVVKGLKKGQMTMSPSLLMKRNYLHEWRL